MLVCNRPVSQLTYSLGGHDNIAIDEKTTLTGLYYGVHFLAVHVIDTSGNTEASKTIIFRVTKPEPFPTTLIVASKTSVAIIDAGVLVYFRKRSHARINKRSEIEQSYT
jgi:hypothetical protein